MDHPNGAMVSRSRESHQPTGKRDAEVGHRRYAIGRLPDSNLLPFGRDPGVTHRWVIFIRFRVVYARIGDLGVGRPAVVVVGPVRVSARARAAHQNVGRCTLVSGKKPG